MTHHTTGPLLPEYTVKYGAVSTIFFNSGVTLKSEVLFHGFVCTELTGVGHHQGSEECQAACADSRVHSSLRPFSHGRACRCLGGNASSR